MRKINIILLIVSFCFIQCTIKENKCNSKKVCSDLWKAVPNNDFNEDSIPNFVVLELFSSESCYDCPASEEALNELVAEARKNRTNIIPIATHIDYWNDLVDGEDECNGNWIDKYSTGRFTARQFAYAKEFTDGPLTPQIIINGKDFIDDPNKKSMDEKVEMYFSASPVYGIFLTLNSEKSNFTNKEIIVDFNIKQQKNVDANFRKNISPQLHLVLVERNLVTKPDKGENCGEILHHENIARVFVSKTIRGAKKGSMMLTYPADANLNNCSVVGYIQNLKNLEIIGGTNGFDFIKTEK